MNYDEVIIFLTKKTIRVKLSLKKGDPQNPSIRKHFTAVLSKHFEGLFPSKDKYTFMILVRNAEGFPFNTDNTNTYYEYITWNPRLKYWFIGDVDYYVKIDLL